MKRQDYISPDLLIVDLETEGVLCASENSYVDSPQDYDPSEGLW